MSMEISFEYYWDLHITASVSRNGPRLAQIWQDKDVMALAGHYRGLDDPIDHLKKENSGKKKTRENNSEIIF